MKRKVYISLLIALFSLANVGLPFTLHVCRMMESVSVENCSACIETIEIKSCCDDENSSPINFTVEQYDCCQIKIAASPIDEKFFLIKTDVISSSVKSIPPFIPTDLRTTNFASEKIFSCDTSPPPSLDNHLYLYNSKLLI